MTTMPTQGRKVRGRRMVVIGTFVETATQTGFKGTVKEIALFTNVQEENGHFSADELRVNCTWGFFKAGIEEWQKGDVVTFSGRIKLCKKVNELGFDLSTLLYPTRIKILKRENAKKR